MVLGPLGSFWARRLKVARVASYHTLYHEYASYHGLGFLKGALHWWMRKVFEDCHLVLAPSASVAELLRQKGLRRVHVWPRGVDVERFHPERRSDEWRLEICGRSRKGLPLILYVGRLAREKNLQTLVDVARQMKGVHWVLVGDGPERGALAEGLRGSVCTFTGYLTGEDLATAYASADVFFMPSTTEGCPNAVMEAFASGLPVVGADAFGTGDLIAESGAGLAFSPSSTREAREALEALLGDQEMWRLCRVRGRAFAEARSWDVLMARLLKYYDKARAFNELGHGLP
jgi:glycosyltransferase involved in cell wall biosynthesis